MHLHAKLKEHSDAIKRARANEELARKYARLSSSKHGQLEKGKYAWLLHGSKEQADYLRKHGHGLPWKHKYKVLDLTPHAVRLEVPKDGSVPRE